MVNFGERLKRMRRPGWEVNYINYDALKVAIEHLLELVDAKEESKKFLETLAVQIKSMDAFVSKQTQKLRSDYVKQDAQALSATRDPRGALESELRELRWFVGTNVIAATSKDAPSSHPRASAHHTRVPINVANMALSSPLPAGHALAPHNPTQPDPAQPHSSPPQPTQPRATQPPHRACPAPTLSASPRLALFCSPPP